MSAVLNRTRASRQGPGRAVRASTAGDKKAAPGEVTCPWRERAAEGRGEQWRAVPARPHRIAWRPRAPLQCICIMSYYKIIPSTRLR